MESALVLTLPEDAERAEENGFLQTYEIYRLRVNAELVTLSGCETGLGRQLGGEGIVGLTRAFMYAGAPSVLVSLWKVADESTAELMKAFYTQLRRGASRDVALQQAMVQLQRDPEYSHPYYWAPFILVGDWRPVDAAESG
jgi:CHAT domain-containing protein